MSDYDDLPLERMEFERAIRQKYPHEHIVWLGFGEANDVARVGERLTYRFPKHAAARKQLAYEFEILGRLQDKTTVTIPAPIELAADKSYGIFTYIPGRQLKNREITALPAKVQREIGHSLARFVIEINSVLQMSEVAGLQISAELPFKQWKLRFKEAQAKAGSVRSAYAAFYRRSLAELMRRANHDFDATNMVIFGDLHAGNLVFDDKHALQGIIDFGQFGVGNVYREAKQVFSMGHEVMVGFLEALDSRFGAVDEETLRLLCIQDELSLLITSEVTGEPSPIRAEIAKRLLNGWLGDGWSELLL